jgi:flagellar motility protein MotE (MotC chaperone)
MEEERKRASNREFSAMNTLATDEPKSPETGLSQKRSFLEYVENNPAAAVIQALAIGFVIGMVVRLIEGSGRKEAEIDVKHKPTLDDAKFHLGSLLLPFLWPAWQKAQEGAGKSAESVREVVEKVKKEVKKGKLTKEGKERFKEVEEWAEELAELGKKKAKDVEKWVEKEAEHLTEAGKKKVEEWVEKEILPAAETGWKKLRKFFG